MISNVKFIGEKELFSVLGRAPAIALHLLRDAIDDIADAVEQEAREEAPFREHGSLKRDPVDRDETIIGFVTRTKVGPRARLEGGGQLGGVQAILPPSVGPGELVARSVITLPENVPHAKWVHNGTGIYGPTGLRITPKKANYFVFYSRSRWWKLDSVAGQKANPYLERAFEHVDVTYAPIRLAHLRAEIKTLT